MAVLFGRQVRVRLDNGSGLARDLTGLRVRMSVKSTSEPSPSEATVDIYNPAPDSVGYLNEGATVEVYAGYTLPRLLFKGNPIEDGVRLEWKGSDRILAVQLADGGDIWSEGRVSVSYAVAIPFSELLTAALEQSGLPTSKVVFPSGSTPGAYAYTGSLRGLLSDLAGRTGNQWFFRDGGLAFFGVGEDTGESALLISSVRGNLIGSPTLKTGKEKGKVEVKALLEPLLRPGMPFVVESREINGQFTVEKIGYSLDSFGNDFTMTILGQQA